MSAFRGTGGRLRLVAVGAAVLVLVGHWALCAAEDQKAVIRNPQGAVATEVGMGDLYAVVVGVSKYKHPKIPQLKVSDKDARDFAEFLKQQTKLFKRVHLTLLTNENATKPALEDQLFYKLRRATKDDTVLVFLSGHGADDPKTPGEYFFLTHDADPERLAVTAVHMNRLWFLPKLESKRIVLIADACHGAGLGEGVTKALTRSRENLQQMFRESEGTIFITSSRPDQTSAEKPEYGHSLFTHHLLEGLAGKADSDGNGVVTLKELYDYVYKKTHAESNGNQSPQWDSRRVVGTFPISLASLSPTPVTRTEPPGASKPTPGELDAIRTRAEQDDPHAQFKLGLMLEFGINVASDKTEAIKWYHRAADKGNGDAKKAIARLLPGQAANGKELWGKALRASEITKHRAFRSRLAKMGLADIDGNAVPVDLEDSSLSDGEWTLVYDVTDSAVMGFLLHGRNIAHGARVNIQRQELQDLVRVVRRGLIDNVWEKAKTGQVTSFREISQGEWDHDALLTSKKIYDSIVRALVEKVPENETLIVVPDDCLALLPFEVLVTNESEDSIPRGRGPKPGEIQFLGDRHPIVYYQSVTALTLARLKWKNSPQPKDKLLIMADPRVECKPDAEVTQDRKAEMLRELRALGSADKSSVKMGKKKALAAMSGEIQFLSRESCRDLELYARLPKTAGLAKAVGTMFEKRDLNIYAGQRDPQATRLPTVYEGKRVEIYSGKDANLIRFQREIQPRIDQYGRLLFATHGVFQDRGGSGGPALMLSTNPPGSYNWLTSRQIAELSMNADVSALIASETGLEPSIGGEGVLSVGRAFHLAGSRTVLMSLWQPEIAASTALAKQFFRKLQAGKSKLQAFQEARSELRTLEHGKYAHPIFWAPFVMLGEAGSPSR